MNGRKKTLTIATSAKSPDAGRTAVAAADLEPPRIFEFGYLKTQRYTYTSSEDTKFIRSEVQRLQYWMQILILSNQPGLPGGRKFLL